MEELKNIFERLDKLDNDKLIDVVKNYRQYGYNEAVREHSLDLLQQRGVTMEDLKLTGNLKNQKYEDAQRIYNSFKANSTIAFISFLVLVAQRLFNHFGNYHSAFMTAFMLILLLLCLLVFFYCLLKSFVHQSDFYKLAGDDYGSGALIYLFLGMPFYIIMYFVFRSQMKHKMKGII